MKLSKTTLFLHWTVGISIIGLLSVGIYMAENEVYSLYPIHKSFGIIILILIVFRIYWRIKEGFPSPLATYTKGQIKLAKILQHSLLLGTLLLPISGMMMSGLGGYGLEVFGLELMAKNVNPDNPKEIMAVHAGLAKTGSLIHEYVGYLLVILVCLHIMAALKHHFINKDATLKRMLGK